MMGPMAKVYQASAYLSLILFVMSALLLAIGIGQLRFRAWAQRWSVYWGVAGLVCVGLMVAISLLVISPAYAEMFESMSRLKPQGGGQAAEPGSMGGIGSSSAGTFAVMRVIFYAPVSGADAAVLHARSRARVDDAASRAVTRGRAEAFGGARLRLGRFFLAVARRAVVVSESTSRRATSKTSLDGAVEGGLVGLRRRREARQLAHELQRRRADLVVGRGRCEVEQCLDAPAHAFS